MALSNHVYVAEDIAKAEGQVFDLLDYYVNFAPPVQMAEHFLALARLERRACDVILHRARMLLNAGLTDYTLVRFSAPCLALAATLNAYAAFGMRADDLLRRIDGIDLKVEAASEEVATCRAALQAALVSIVAAGQTRVVESHSPTAVNELQIKSPAAAGACPRCPAGSQHRWCR